MSTVSNNLLDKLDRKKANLVAGILFSVYALLSLRGTFMAFIYSFDDLIDYFNFYRIFYFLSNAIGLIALILVPVAFFIKKDNLKCLGFALFCARYIIGLLYNSFFLSFFGSLLLTVLNVLPFVLLTIALFKHSKKLCFAAGAACVVCFIGRIFLRIFGPITFHTVLLMLIMAVACIITGYTINESSIGATNKVNTKKELQKHTNPTDTIERLTKLKALLDSGLISQEEFDAKKNQLMGL